MVVTVTVRIKELSPRNSVITVTQNPRDGQQLPLALGPGEAVKSVFVVLAIKLSASHVLSKHPTTELCPHPSVVVLS